jgi:hypothetical protein
MLSYSIPVRRTNEDNLIVGKESRYLSIEAFDREHDHIRRIGTSIGCLEASFHAELEYFDGVVVPFVFNQSVHQDECRC